MISPIYLSKRQGWDRLGRRPLRLTHKLQAETDDEVDDETDEDLVTHVQILDELVNSMSPEDNPLNQV